jgi:hypothetical protein
VFHLHSWTGRRNVVATVRDDSLCEHTTTGRRMHASGAERAHLLPCPLCPAQDPSGAVAIPAGGGDLDTQFTTMDLAFVRHGGMLCSDEVVRRMRSRKEQGRWTPRIIGGCDAALHSKSASPQ